MQTKVVKFDWKILLWLDWEVAVVLSNIIGIDQNPTAYKDMMVKEHRQ